MRGLVTSRLEALLAAARDRGDRVLPETEAAEVARTLGVRVPERLVVPNAAAVAGLDLAALPGNRCVVKAVVPGLAHKTEAGAVAIVEKDPRAIEAAVDAMAVRLVPRAATSFILEEYVPHDTSFGSELLLGIRFTPDFGPVVVLGPGGVLAEHWAATLRPGTGAAFLSPYRTPFEEREAIIGRTAIGPILFGGWRGLAPAVPRAGLASVVSQAMEFAVTHMPHDVAEIEINPLVFTPRGPVALDAFVRPGAGPDGAVLLPEALPHAARPLRKLKNLMEPRSVALVGVSDKANPGRIILDNLLREGFPTDRIRVVKPDRSEIAGVRCVPDVASLPSPVDLLVLAVDAAQIPGLVEQAVASRAAESILVIPGGLGESAGSQDAVLRVRRAIDASRSEDWKGPVVNGGNCLGIRSVPGRCDTMFIPARKLPRRSGPDSPLALVSQSGAFAVARTSRLDRLNPRYVISVGNQIDLTVGDYTAWLASDRSIEVVACYIEGFRPMDGAAWLEAARRIVDERRTVILYRAGRTAEGARASASHTASLASDYAVARSLAEAAGVVVAETLEDFDDLIDLFVRLRGKSVRGRRLGAMSNAGFECVAIADAAAGFRLAAYSASTQARLTGIFETCRLGGIVAPRNPLDVTPILDDARFAEAAAAIVDDPGVDVVVVGCVPLTGALRTLPEEGAGDEGAIADRLTAVAAGTEKPVVAVVDAGPMYDPFARRLSESGFPVFRSADRALRLLDVFCRARARGTGA